MSTADTKRAEKLARESAELAHKALQKSDELHACLSVLEYRAGKVRQHMSVGGLFRKLKLA
jgi:hypothetical protein